jgi:hypothetical protein
LDPLEAAIIFLREQGEPRHVNVIAKELLRRGIQTTAAVFKDSIYGSLRNEIQKKLYPRVTYAGGKWGLTEWEHEGKMESPPSGET